MRSLVVLSHRPPRAAAGVAVGAGEAASVRSETVALVGWAGSADLAGAPGK